MGAADAVTKLGKLGRRPLDVSEWWPFGMSEVCLARCSLCPAGAAISLFALVAISTALSVGGTFEPFSRRIVSEGLSSDCRAYFDFAAFPSQMLR